MQHTEGMSENDRKAFVEGLKRYQQKGIPVFIDNRQVNESQLERVLERNQPGYFYMGDYILEENPDFTEHPAIREDSAEYSAGPQVRRFRLKEIRFDRVYRDAGKKK